MSDVPEGYKQSGVGVIPEEWEVKKLGVVADVKTGPFGSSLHERDYVNDGTPIITVEHLGEQGVVHKNLPMVSDFDRKRLNAYALQPDDIVFSRVGSVDRNSLIKEKESGWLFSGRLLRIRLTTKFIFPSYLSYYFHQEPTKQRIRSVAVGQTMASLNTEILKNIEVAIPPTIEEQQAIASALSDVDALITALEQLITKKRNIKQGAMQQLLTGEKRLSGFGGAWEVRRINQVGEVKRGAGSQCIKYVQNSGVRLIRINDFFDNNPVYVEPTEEIMRFSISKEDILFAGTGASAGASYIPKKEWIGLPHSYNVPRIRLDKSATKEYILYFLQSENIAKQQNALFVGAAQPFLDTKAIANFKIFFPPRPEQQAIAQILSDMDTEVESLEQKRDKYKAIKQGMMQELLTGKTRLAKEDKT